jgi:hypothetical protein
MKKELEILKERFVNARSEREKDLIIEAMIRLGDSNGRLWADCMLELARDTADRAERLVERVKADEMEMA